MPYHIEILTTDPENLQTIASAIFPLNQVQQEFVFTVATPYLLESAYTYKLNDYKSQDVFEWLEKYKINAGGQHHYIILVVNGSLEGRKYKNLFGDRNDNGNMAVFTVKGSLQFVNDTVRFCRYYFVRYALTFFAPELTSHIETRGCIFDFKEHKRDILLSLNTGFICNECNAIMGPHFRPGISQAIERMLLVVSEHHPIALVMKGGGVKGLAYAGALIELGKHYSFNMFAGTSAGAIAAVLLGAGYKPKELLTILKDKDLKDLTQTGIGKIIKNVFTGEGVFDADNFEEWVQELLRKKTNKIGNIKLEDLPQRTIMYAARRSDGTLVFDSNGPRKETKASKAARYSMSIPYFFVPEEMEGEKVFDGGLLNNFPIRRFISDHPEQIFLGLYLKSPLKKTSWKHKELYHLILDGEEVEYVDKYRDRMIVIDTEPIGIIDFKLSDDEKKFLIKTGQLAALSFLNVYKTDVVIVASELRRLSEEVQKLKAKIVKKRKGK